MTENTKGNIIGFTGATLLILSIIGITALGIVRANGQLYSIENTQNEWIKNSDTYKQIQETTDITGLKYRVDQYVVWKGFDQEPSKGYQIYEINDKNEIRSYGFGELAPELSHEWKPLIISIATK